MRGAVVYYSRYGNNERTAKAILEGLREAGHDVDLINAKRQKELGKGYQFIIVGSPTRFSRTSGPVKKFIKKNLGGAQWKDFPFAAFGTCLQQACEREEKTAAKDIRELLEKNGLQPLADPLDSPVTGMKGPLAEQGEEKAREFGREVGAKLSG